jgi:hypothetical protein
LDLPDLPKVEPKDLPKFDPKDLPKIDLPKKEDFVPRHPPKK